ncbi:MAG: YhcH/YjgK/YiaL family protein [Clostridia bacterium]|nr:YhcH/YjgK/YiaL family protein [Clostridia bacterium]
MIFDVLSHGSQYYSLHKDLREAFNFIQKAVKEELPVGRYDIDGTDAFAIVQEYMAKPEEEGRWEAHRKYIDLQYIVSGKERMDVTAGEPGAVTEDYDQEKDVIFYEDCADVVSAIVAEEGFGIFFPHDIHKPSLAIDGIPVPVKKIVVKLPYEDK